jgi:hypothetical protein
MTDDLRRIAERLRQSRLVRQQDADTARVKPPCAEGRLGCMFLAGDRVFDRVTGQEGVVRGATRENLVVPTAGRPDR